MAINRRNFLTTSALASGGLIFNQPKTRKLDFQIPADFKLTILATNWGFQGKFDQFCEKAKADNYDGIEVWVPRQPEQQKAFKETVEKYGLQYGLLAGAGGNDFVTHFAQFQESVNEAIKLKPLFINCHSGRDYFSFEENKRFIELTTELSQQHNIPIYHETHRARILFAAHISKQYIEALPDLRLTLDISHWCNVHSSLLEDQKETVDLALARVGHIHSRVGHSNSPQITDPRGPEWEDALNAHFAWWDQVVKYKTEAQETLTMTTEFGPPSYMATLPFTNQPVTDLWTINVHMKDLWRERYK